jgi:hypothetical protein
MFRFGILTLDQLLRLPESRAEQGFRVALSLLAQLDLVTDGGQAFEDICFRIRLSNGTFRTSHKDRFLDLDHKVNEILANRGWGKSRIRVQDRAVSHALTAAEWATQIFRVFPDCEFEASDLLLHLVELTLPDGTGFVAEPDGKVLQYISPPFVVGLAHPEPRRYPVNHLVALWGRRRFRQLRLPQDWTSLDVAMGNRVRKIPFTHPLARKLAHSDSRFRLVQKSVFDDAPASCDVLRTMNILNLSYFSVAELESGARAAHRSLTPGGLWIIGRTSMETNTNHASILVRTEGGWELHSRLGEGSEIEKVVFQTTYKE